MRREQGTWLGYRLFLHLEPVKENMCFKPIGTAELQPSVLRVGCLVTDLALWESDCVPGSKLELLGKGVCVQQRMHISGMLPIFDRPRIQTLRYGKIRNGH